MIPVEECTHKTLYFASGDYYIFCQDCNAHWGRLRWGRPEYDQFDGKWVGSCPEDSNKGPTIVNRVRKEVDGI